MLSSLRNWIRTFSERYQASAKLRWTIRGALAALFCLLLALPTYRLVLGVWLAWNIALFLGCVSWVLFHPRSTWGVLLNAAQTALRWAFPATLLTSLALYAWSDRAMATYGGPVIPTGAVALTILILVPFIFGGYVLSGLACAAIGVFQHRHQRDIADAARLYTHAGWLASLLMIALFQFYHQDENTLVKLTQNNIAVAFFFGFTLITIWSARGLQRLMEGQESLFRRFANFLNRFLALHWIWRGRSRRLDLRGASWGVLAATLVFAVDGIELLTPLQSGALATMLKVRGGLASRLGSDDENLDTRTVLLEINKEAQRLALTERSECAMQADLIQRLRGYGVTRIVLPAPALTTERPRRSLLMRDAPSQESVNRNLRDLPLLTKAMREAGNVTLVLRPIAAKNSERAMEALRKAAKETTQSDLRTYGTAHLVGVPATWKQEPPAPILLFAAARNKPPEMKRLPGRNDIEVIAGETVPLFHRDFILTDFASLESNRLITRLDYTEVLRGEAVYLPGARPARKQAMRVQANQRRAGIFIDDERPSKTDAPAPKVEEWIAPETFFKGKVVFLDSLAREEEEIYLGSLSNTEMIARATDALLAGRLVRRINPLRWAIFTILLCALMGHLITRLEPLEASWRIGTPILLLSVFSIVRLCFPGVTRVWADPIVPFFALAGTFVLVTQFTYAQERQERRRNRALLQRFVAPQIVDTLLNNFENLGLGGTRQQVCVLFADVRNFTSFAESNTPEVVIEVINEYMAEMRKAMFDSDPNWVLDKYTGDGLMAFYRITGEESQGVRAAVAGALKMRDAAERVSQTRIAAGKQALALGIGLHYGTAIVGLVGDLEQFNYTALGLTVVVSARLQSIASGGEVIVSEEVYAITDGAFRAAALAPVPVKGFSEPVRPYRITHAETPALLPEPSFDLAAPEKQRQ